MPRRSILSATERASLLALPDTEDELIRHYTFSEADLSLIRLRCGDANRLGVAVQLCLLRFPGQGLLPDANVPAFLLQWYVFVLEPQGFLRGRLVLYFIRMSQQ